MTRHVVFPAWVAAHFRQQREMARHPLKSRVKTATDKVPGEMRQLMAKGELVLGGTV